MESRAASAPPWEGSRRTSAHPWQVRAAITAADPRRMSAGGDQPQLDRTSGRTLKMAGRPDNCSSKMNDTRWGFCNSENAGTSETGSCFSLLLFLSNKIKLLV